MPGLKLYVDKSGIEGKGIFAKKEIKKGETVFVMKGKIKRFVVKNQATADTGPNWVGIGKNTWIDPAYPFLYMNHSCNPNMGIRGRVTFVALRNIKKDEELTVDYSITEETTQWKMKNKERKVPGYRPIIRSIQFLPLKTFQKYMPYVPTYFQKVYTEYHRIHDER